MIDPNVLVTALQGHLIVTLTYQKKTTGETVTHTGGLYEINSADPSGAVVWLWDTSLNDHIRKFLIGNIIDVQVLQEAFVPTQGWPFKLNGQIIP
jgi:hypothetical protein